MATAAPTPLASGDTAYLYRAAIGERSQDYYLRQFARFDGEGKTGSSWNWAAYWTTFNWLLYRKMWGWALAYVGALIGLALLVFGVGKLVLNYSDTSAILLSLLLLTLAFVVPGLYANAWFYTHCNEKISAALRETPDLKQAATALAGDAPGNRRLLLLALGNSALLAVALLVFNGVQSSGADLPQLATREERVQTTGPVAAPAPVPATASAVTTAVAAPPPAVAASAPVAADSAPGKPALADAAPPAAVPPAPAAAQAAGSARADAAAPKSTPSAPATAVVSPTPANTSIPVATPAARITVADRAPAAPRSDAAATARATVAATAAPQALAVAPPFTPSASAPAAPVRYVWVVQVGAYAQEDNARRALAQVQGLGLDAGAETFTTGRGPLVRVRVGPFTRQAEAEQAALRIKALDLPVLVIRQRP